MKPETIRRRLGIAGTLGALAAGVWAGGCRDGSAPVPPPPAPAGKVVVSNVIASPLPTSPRSGAGTAPTEPTIAYVSLPPDSVPGGTTAVVVNRRTGANVTTALRDGGFDPVPVEARAEDTLDIAVTVPAQPNVMFDYAVPARLRPVVVRTDPSSGKRDVPLNTTIVIVFSEPIDPATLTASSVQLLLGTSVVAGSVSLLEGSATDAVFTPAALLQPNTDYHLDLTEDVRDLDGDPLAGPVTIEFTTGARLSGAATLVTVFPDSATVLVGSTVQLFAGSRDTSQLQITTQPVTWSIDNPSVATISSTGLVTARAPGTAHPRATVDGTTGEGVVVVVALASSVQTTPASATIPATGGIELTAVLKDASGNILPLGDVTWTSSNPAIATIVSDSARQAFLSAVGPGSATITATSNGRRGLATITVVSPGYPFVRLVAGFSHTCGVTSASWVLCWGRGTEGQLGRGSQLSSNAPAAIVDSVRFAGASAGGARTCAVAPAGAAHCWGDNFLGGLGTGTAPGQQSCSLDQVWGGGLIGSCALAPSPVTGGSTFATLAIGGAHLCALTAGGAAYCWGDNTFGQLGLGSNVGPTNCGSALGMVFQCANTPTATATGLAFTQLVAGRWHTCAVANSGATYCWGINAFGQLGDSSATDRARPVAVRGSLTFVALASGSYHTCGLTSDGTAYCWGRNDGGQLGVASSGPDACPGVLPRSAVPSSCSIVPIPVSGGLRFTVLAGGGAHTCGITADGTAYCWGANPDGELGTGNPQGSATSVAVAGGLTFGG
ncbi:MAG TPA: Ig-like domain-containing protein, partial [Gemmatimonadales bacterium]|nr:Ig-like domain-containing protein [Gemmatimonadales bacterium]